MANALKVVDFDAETLEQRLLRRKARWTPVLAFDVTAANPKWPPT